jgi:type II secretory pathway pseudopilin PulG
VAKARRHIAAHLRGSADGITMAIFAIALVVLLGFVALGIDGARGFDERREAQNAADHAAIAAAYASCTETSTDPAVLLAAAIAAGEASALENGYDDNETTNDVEIDVAPGAAGAGDHKYTAAIETTIETTFAKIIGSGDIDTRGEATAEATGCDETAGGPVPALYGGGTCPDSGKYSIQTNGQNHHIYGTVHSEDEIDLGSTNNFHDAVTYVTDSSDSPKNHTDDTYDAGPPTRTAPKGWPANPAPGFNPAVITGATTGDPGAGTFLKPYYDLANTAVPSQVHTGSSVSIDKPGVWYMTSNSEINVSFSSAFWAGASQDVVLIATQGPIKISGGLDHQTLSSYDHASLPMADLLLLSNEIYTGNAACDNFTVQISAQHGTFNGILWGSRGLVEMSASNQTINGALVGHAIRLNGSDIVVNAPSGTGAQEPFVQITN